MRRLALVLALTAWPAAARGQVGPVPGPAADAPDAEPPEESVDDVVARALFEQGVHLFHRGLYVDARQLFVESLSRRSDGPYAASARRMIARCDERLGRPVAPPDAPRPGEGGEGGGSGDEPLDPYGTSGTREDEPLDPYGSGKPDVPSGAGAVAGAVDDEPVEAYPDPPRAEHPEHPALGQERRDDSSAGSRPRRSRRTLLVTGAAAGGLLGAGMGAASDSGGAGGTLLAIGGAAVGLGTTYFLVGDREVTEGQALAVASTTVWGTVGGLLVAHLADDPEACGDGSDPACPEGAEDVEGGDYALASGLGAALGAAGGLWLSRRDVSSGDVALVNSVGAWGGAAGLALGLALDPPDARAYSVNATVGLAAGGALGVLLARRYEPSRRRMAHLDLGVALGALVGLPAYALLGSDAGAAQGAGVVSLLGMGAGGYLAWRWTRNDDARQRAGEGAAMATPPALVARDATGRWGLGAPSWRPLPGGAAVDLVAGSF